MSTPPGVPAFVVVFCGLAAGAQAQVGSGWTPYTSNKGVQRQGATAHYSNSGGVETFRIGEGDRRSEIQMNTKWSSGSRQFEGFVNCSAGSGGAGSSIQQVMRDGDPDGDIHQVRIYSGGRLGVLGGATIATGVYGRWVRINVIHDRGANRVETYVDGVRKSVKTVGGGSTNYFKYGIYLRPGECRWRGIKTWRK